MPAGVSDAVFYQAGNCVLNAFFLKASGCADYQQKAAMVGTFPYRHLRFPGRIDYFVRSWISPENLRAEELNLRCPSTS